MNSSPQRRSILIASIGTSPGVLTNAVWAPAHQKKPVVHNARTLVQLAVSSPGPLPKGMTVAMLKRRHRSIPVNPLLAQGMYLRGYIEHVGSGTGDIIEKCRESGLPPPQWESEDDGLTIILRRATIASQPQTDRGGANASQTAPKHHRDAFDDALESRLLDALRKDASSDQVELSKILGVSRATVQRCFKRLLKAGKVGRIGGKRFGHWEVLA